MTGPRLFNIVWSKKEATAIYRFRNDVNGLALKWKLNLFATRLIIVSYDA